MGEGGGRGVGGGGMVAEPSARSIHSVNVSTTVLRARGGGGGGERHTEKGGERERGEREAEREGVVERETDRQRKKEFRIFGVIPFLKPRWQQFLVAPAMPA